MHSTETIDMGLKVAVQMDPIQSINITGDSTFAMMLEAQRRGHNLFYDVLLMRQDPPFDMGYITPPTCWSDSPEDTGGQRSERGAQRAGKALCTANYPQLMPDTLITRDPIELAAFRREHGDIILKPLYGNGGAGVFRLGEGDQNFSLAARAVHADLQGALHRAEIPARRAEGRQAHHPRRWQGRRRHQPRAGPGRGRSNMHVGGRPEPTTLTKREHEICEAIGPELLKARA
jgi:glutathione synthase